ncbi:MAG: ATP-binding cassette domain-containing protein [Clostridia bacterium]|nr:ATP-binding cassette domain-containing protein [Clostridia bacterium]
MIEVKNLRKTFTKVKKKKGLKGFFFPDKEKFEAVQDISFNVNKGELVAFVGPNGAGKSTTIKMLTGIIHPSSGEITVAGLNPTKDRKKLAYKIGCMFGQKSGLWMHLPAIDTYKLYGAMYDIEPKELEKRIDEIVKMFDLQEIINMPVRKLSLGQRMICEIGAIMIHKPEILFLDEPTIGLDIVVKEKVRNAILKVNKTQNTTIFLTSHDLGDIEKICERIVIIDNGRIIKDENIESLKSEYLQERYVTLVYDENIENVDFDYRINGKEGNKVMIKVDTSKQAMSDVISKFMKYGNVIDMEAMPVPLEEVIYDIYTRNL